MIKKIFLSFLFLWYFFGAAICANAFSISPLKFSATVAPGDKKEWEIKVKNDSDQGKVFVPVILGLKQDPLGRSVFDNNIDIAENWFETPLDNIALAPGETRNVVFNLKVPFNTPPGAHYLGLGIKEKSGQSISAQLVTILNLQVSGVAQEVLLLDKFLVSKKIFFNKNWLTQLQIRNAGNIGLELAGQQQIFYFGKETNQKFFNLGNALFAQSNRSAELNFAPDRKIILPGFYRVDVNIFYGISHQAIKTSASFWYLPPWFLSLLGMALLVAIFIFRKNKNVVV